MIYNVPLDWVRMIEAGLDKVVKKPDDVLLCILLHATLVCWKDLLYFAVHEFEWSSFVLPQLLHKFDECSKHTVLLAVKISVGLVADDHLVQGHGMN